MVTIALSQQRISHFISEYKIVLIYIQFILGMVSGRQFCHQINLVNQGKNILAIRVPKVH